MGDSPKVQEGPAELAQQQINAKLFNYYVSEYKPLITKYAERVTSPAVQEQEKKQVAGQINAEVMKNIDTTMATQDPVKNARVLSDAARTEARAQVTGQGAVESRNIGETQNVINIGRGEAATAQAGMSDLAGISMQSEINKAALEQEEKAAQMDTLGSLAGLAAGGAYTYLNNTPRTMGPKPLKTGEIPQESGYWQW